MSRWPKWIIWLLGLALVLTAAAEFTVVKPRSAWSNLPISTAVGGALALSVCLTIARNAKRPFGMVDAVRSVGWTLIGCGAVLSPVARGYYAHFWPQQVPVAQRCAAGLLVLGVSIVIVASLFLQVPKPLQPGHCDRCGYDLTGNVSGICPECGMVIRTEAPSESVPADKPGAKG